MSKLDREGPQLPAEVTMCRIVGVTCKVEGLRWCSTSNQWLPTGVLVEADNPLSDMGGLRCHVKGPLTGHPHKYQVIQMEV